MWNSIADQISQVIGKPFVAVTPRSVGGGCINQGYKLTDGTSTYFVKLNQASQIAMFEAEAVGLRQLAATQTIRVPQPICSGIVEGTGYLVLEWIDLGQGDRAAWTEMGRQLAALHQVNSSHEFGWDRNNTIGATPQINTWTPTWADFWTEHRIGYQVRLAERNGGHFPHADRLLHAIPDLLAGHQPQPALVHGDLWSGNAAIAQTGEPVIFDPATYYGDREVDIAMTELFGGFPDAFYQGYNQACPLDSSYAQRKILYNRLVAK